MTTAALNTTATGIENKIPDITSLATESTLNTKAAEVESKITDITNLVTKASLKTKSTQTKNKIPGNKYKIPQVLLLPLSSID